MSSSTVVLHVASAGDLCENETCQANDASLSTQLSECRISPQVLDIFGCGADCLLAVFNFIPTLPQWACLQQVCRRWQETCRLPTWLGLLKPPSRSLVNLMDVLDDNSRSIDVHRRAIKLMKSFAKGVCSHSILKTLDTKIKTITKQAITMGNVNGTAMGLEFLSPDSDFEKEPFLFLSLRAPSYDVFNLLVEKKADISMKWWDQSVACRLGLGCAWPPNQKREVFDQLRVSDELLPELEAATLGDQAWVERVVAAAGDVARNACLKSDALGFTALHYACSSNQLDMVKFLVETGLVPVDQATTEGFTALTRACRNGHVEVVKYLVEQGAAIDTIGNEWPPIIFAASEGREEAVEVLLRAKAIVNTADSEGFASLFAGVQCRSYNICKALVDAKADVNQSKKNGWTPLHLAASNGDEAIVALLITSNANVDDCRPEDTSKWTPLCHAVHERNYRVVDLLLDFGASLKHATRTGRTAIQLALASSDIRMVRLLLQKGVNVNQCDESGRSLLLNTLQTEEPDLKIIETLLEMKANIEPSGVEEHRSPLHLLVTGRNMKPVAQMILERKYSDNFYVAVVGGDAELVREHLAAGRSGTKYTRNLLATAALHGNDAVVSLLIEHEPPSAMNLFGALIDASFLGHLRSVQLLVEAKAPVNQDATEGDTPLMGAAANGHFKVAEYLLEQKANVDLQFGYGWTPLMGVAWRGQQTALEILLEAKANIHLRSLTKIKGQHLPPGLTALWLAVRENHLEIAQRLLELRANVEDFDDKNHDTCLHIASRNGHANCVKLLLEAGARPSQTNKHGKTALYLAALNERKEVMEVLIKVETPDLFAALIVKDLKLLAKLVEEKADVNAMKQGKTPLYVACKRRQKEAVALLLDSKALPQLACENGKTPIEEANVNIEIVRLLVAAGAPAPNDLHDL